MNRFRTTALAFLVGGFTSRDARLRGPARSILDQPPPRPDRATTIDSSASTALLQ